MHFTVCSILSEIQNTILNLILFRLLDQTWRKKNRLIDEMVETMNFKFESATDESSSDKAAARWFTHVWHMCDFCIHTNQMVETQKSFLKLSNWKYSPWNEISPDWTLDRPSLLPPLWTNEIAAPVDRAAAFCRWRAPMRSPGSARRLNCRSKFCCAAVRLSCPSSSLRWSAECHPRSDRRAGRPGGEFGKWLVLDSFW